MVKVGEKYRHYKRGGEYEVVGLGRNSETDEEVVIYKALYVDEHFALGQLWVRSLTGFMGMVEHNGKLVSRFAKST